MPAPKSPDPKSARATFRAEPALLQRAQAVAAARGISHGAFLRGAVTRATAPHAPYSVQLPLSRRAAFERHAAALGSSPEKVFGLAAAVVAELSDPAVRALVAPAWRTLMRTPEVHSLLLSKGLLIPLTAFAQCPGKDCPVPALRAGDAVMPPPSPRARLIELLELPAGATDEQVLTAVQKILDDRPPPEPAPEQYRRSALYPTRPVKAAPSSRKQSAPAPAATSCQCEGEAGLEDFERRDAAKIKDPERRARFVASRLARKAHAKR